MAGKLASILGASSSEIDANTKQGWMFKRSKHLKSWKKRFIRLIGDQLLSYRTEFRKNSKQKPTEIFDLSTYNVGTKTNQFTFYLISPTLTFRAFRTETVEERDDWVFQIRHNIMSSNTKVRRAVQLFATKESQFQKQQKHCSEQSVSNETFKNYKVRRLSINPQGYALGDEEGTSSGDDDDDKEDTMGLPKIEDDEHDDDNTVCNDCGLKAKGDEYNGLFYCDECLKYYDDENKVIIDQLITFGYDKQDIIKVMKDVVDSKNINEIRDKLDETIALKSENIDKKTQKMARKRKFIEQEIVTTEETYYEGLNTLLNELIEPIFDKGFVDRKYHKQCLSSIPQLLAFHEDFYCKLKAVYQSNDDTETLANVFNTKIMQNKEQFIDIYMEFIKGYEGILALFGSTFHGNVKLDRFLAQKRMEMKPLPNFLILPVQRIPRYIMLLADLRKNTVETSTDYKAINDAVQMTTNITVEINDRKRKIENLSTGLEIQNSLIGLKEPIMNGDRTFVEQFIFIKKEIKHQRLFFLFNDIVIIANEQWSVKYILKVKMVQIGVKEDETDDKEEDMKKRKRKGLLESIHTYKFGDITRGSYRAMNMKKKGLPEFELMSKELGKVIYVAKNIETVNKFKMLLDKCNE